MYVSKDMHSTYPCLFMMNFYITYEIAIFLRINNFNIFKISENLRSPKILMVWSSCSADTVTTKLGVGTYACLGDHYFLFVEVMRPYLFYYPLSFTLPFPLNFMNKKSWERVLKPLQTEKEKK